VDSLRRSLSRERQQRNEAQEQQAAISEVLRVMSSSPADVQPVLQAVAERAAKICEASDARIWLLEGNDIRHAAGFGDVPMPVELGGRLPLDRGVVPGRAILDRAPVHVEDMAKLSRDDYPISREMQERSGFRTILAVPLLREQRALGAIMLRRMEVCSFTDKQIALLKTFADQAAIAIENVRLFNETKESLERQTATADILRVISSSPTNIQPVLDAVAERAAQLCGATDAVIALRRGDTFGFAAHYGNIPITGTRVLTRESVAGRAILEGQQFHIRDLQSEVKEFPQGSAFAKQFGYRTMLATPLIREGSAMGAILVRRIEARPFSEAHLALVRTFADQAVIAIENVRLFNETKEALEQQKASAEILRVISSSPTDTQPVFEAIVRNATRLCEGAYANVFRYDGELIHWQASHGWPPELLIELKNAFPMRPNPSRAAGRVILSGQAVRIEDIRADAEYDQDLAKALRYRRILGVPLLREGKVLGALMVGWSEPGPVEQRHEDLLKTFADQAVIAIENVRLFNETKEALDQQTATAEILKVISSSPTDVQPVFDAIVQSAARLFEPCNAVILMRQGSQIHWRARAGLHASQEQNEAVAKLYPLPLDPQNILSARVLAERRMVEVLDSEAADVPDFTVRASRAAGWRSGTFVPLMREGEGIGVMGLTHPAAGFKLSEKQLKLVRTFADQAVIAIENVRLFREIEEKSQQLEVANKHKSDFLANMSHELRTPLNAIIGFSEGLIERMFGELNEKQADYLKDIHESGKHLLSLINDILDLSKIEAGKMELELSNFHLPAAISNAVTLIRERAQRHGIALGVEIDERLGEFQADERKLKQILLNLLSNAVKFTPDGGRVEVSAKLDTDKIEIAIKDTGVGIAPEDQASLFEEFKQLGKDSLRKAEGTGLGLALTKRLVELHGGEISVQSVIGEGSIFRVNLPLRR
jgi:signal transduction histidine kinase